jgi:hypothetical protein
LEREEWAFAFSELHMNVLDALSFAISLLTLLIKASHFISKISVNLILVTADVIAYKCIASPGAGGDYSRC